MKGAPDIHLAILPPYGTEGPPLGLACVAAALRQAGYTVKAVDYNIFLYRRFQETLGYWWDMSIKTPWILPAELPDTIAAFGDAFDEMIDEMALGGAKIVGFSLNSDNRKLSAEVMRRVKARNPQVKIIAGGLDAFTAEARRYFPKNLVDAFVVGEGELATVELVNALLAGDDPLDVPGVAQHDEPRQSRKVEKNQDSFAFPTYEDFDLTLYTTHNLPLVISRGCVKGCTLCNDRKLMGSFRTRGAAHVFEEIRYHVEHNNVRDFMLSDLQISQNLDVLLPLCHMIIDAGLDIHWNANAAVSERLTPEVLETLRAAGCHTLTFGVESGSDAVLRLMNKKTDAQSTTNTLRAVKEAQIICWINIVVGFPGETDEHFHETLAWLEANRDLYREMGALNACNVVDNSIIGDYPERYGILPTMDHNWIEVAWSDRFGNTPALRLERLKQVHELLARLEKPIRQSNLEPLMEYTRLAEIFSDVLLVRCPPDDTDLPPYPLASAAAYLQRRGFKVQGLDLNILAYNEAPADNKHLWRLPFYHEWTAPERLPDTLARLGLDIAQMARQIAAVNCHQVYFHLSQGNLLITQAVLTELRKLTPDRKLIIGGDRVAIEPERNLFPEPICDFAIEGELEETLADLLRRLQGLQPATHLRGAHWVNDRGEPRYIPREPIRELDELGAPTYEEFPPAQYESPLLPLRLSRGCAFRCAFCQEQPTEGVFRTRSAKAVYDEMCRHRDTWDISAFQFTDPVIDGGLNVLTELCELIVADGRPFRWFAQIAPRGDLTPELFALMARAGCFLLRFGVESFSDALLSRMNKQYTACEAIENLRAAKQAGIETHVNLLVGFPGETDEDFHATVRTLRDEAASIDFVDEITPCYVYPNAALEIHCAHYHVLLPEGSHFRTWSFESYNNFSWRETRAKELAVFVAGLDIQFNYDFFVPPHDPLRKIEEQVRRRLHKKIRPAPDAVLVTLPPWGFENPPVGLAYLSTYLRAHGLQTEVIDFNIKFYHDVHEIYRMLWHVENKNFWSNEKTYQVVAHSLRGQIDAAIKELVERKPKLLGFSVVDPKERITIEVIKGFRKHNREAKIILGGPACFTPEYRQIFIDHAGDLIDGYCVGEGEETLLETARRVREGRDLAGIPGLLVLDENHECQLVEREPIMDLDRVPHPRYEEFDLDIYPGDSLILEWSRGCIGNCTYCKGKQISGDYRTRSAAHIFAELEYHYRVNRIDNFTISDNLINGCPEVLEELCDKIIAAQLPIRFNGEGIPLPAMDGPILEKLARAGCYELQWGLESGSEIVLKAMNKRRFFKPEQAARVVRRSHEAGIKTCLFIIVGFPGETDAEWQKTMDFVRANAEWIDQIKSINSMHVITGTMVHLHAERFGIELPERDYHYLWRSVDGTNTPAVRNRRIRELLALCQDLSIEVRETNLTEGKQNDLAASIGDESLSMELRMKMLIDEINDLRSFETDTVEAGDVAGAQPDEEEGAGDEIDAEFVGDHLALAGVLDGERVFAGPELLEIDLTNFCNLNCIGCWNHSPLMRDKQFSGEEKKRRLPLELLIRLIDDAAALGAKQVQLSGAGEPFCHPDALRVIERIKAHGLQCTVITNGTLLTESICRRIVELGVDHLTVSVWAGTPKVYEATHPNQKGKTLLKLQNTLRLLHQIKREQRTYYPQVKIYHVVNHRNAGDLDAMVTFAVESLAEYIEFTPIDTVPGYTDELALTDDDRRRVAEQLRALPQRDDYLELDPTQGHGAPGELEKKEFARFVKRSILPKGFKYELDDITRFDVLCPRKEWRLDVREDNQVENAMLFFYPMNECANCPLNPKCEIDKERYVVKVEFTSFLGYGAFLRRISTPAETGAYDADMVDSLPCCVGWTYARVKTDGAVIPCCKADKMPLGNLHQQRFLDLWTDEPYREFRAKALTLSKRDKFFAPIGCLIACDNLGQNVQTQERLETLTADERAALRNVEKKGFGEL
ncbi:MAG TPA: radical SAM protein [bacterium]|nr:radical SAM protein [bacterium]